MLGLKRVLSRLGMRKDADDELPPYDRRQSLMKRSNAVLSEKPKLPANGDHRSSSDAIQDALSRWNIVTNENDVPHDVAHDNYRNSMLDFETEIHRMVRSKTGGRVSNALFQPGVRLDDVPSPIRREVLESPEADHASKPSQQDPGKDTMESRHSDPLGIVREGAVPQLKPKLSIDTTFASRRRHQRSLIPWPQEDKDLSSLKHSLRRLSSSHRPAADLHGAVAEASQPHLKRREAWVHVRKGCEQVIQAGASLDRVGHSPYRLPFERSTNHHSQSISSSAAVARGATEESDGLGHGGEIDDSLSSSGHHPGVSRNFSTGRLSQADDNADTREYVDVFEDSAIRLTVRGEEDEPVRVQGPSVGQAGLAVNVRDCLVCGNSKPTLNFPANPPTSSCKHPIQTCSACLSAWMASEIDSKGIEGIKCPECPQVLTYLNVQCAASPATFLTYDTLTTRAALGNLPDFAYCLSPTCSSGQENHANANFMHCVACGYEQCASHLVPWHVGETCAEYTYRTSGQKQRDDEVRTERMLDDVSQKCPNPAGCGWRIQKVDGCDHMTCRRCRWEFCWACGAGQEEIRRVGNTAHRADCVYHSRNLEVGWPFNMH